MVAIDPAAPSTAISNRVVIRLAQAADRSLISSFLNSHGGRLRVCRSNLVDLSELNAYLAFIGHDEATLAGLASARVVGKELEIAGVVARDDLDVVESSIRRLLLGEALRWLPDGIKRVRYIVANNELGAIADAQRVGLRLVTVRPASIERFHKTHPELRSMLQRSGIEARDEVELELLVP